ncbi:Aste57867_12824 [Aphanomyces stellatus]|uniref:Aste57867_12824 protein n=1 Tax=Aphanomyces stellatus TaxID=120398 RepID=A0A485KYK8_9STRA|nr:hypothetical protein As57867_012776 [Aphanomyces stellatus]VFT89671.1 Aste57867_12824 [Aphanomyces stellatus]
MAEAASKQVISGWLFRRTTTGFFQVKGTGDWSSVWCEFDVNAGLFAVYLDGEKYRRLLNWKIQLCSINHVRNDGRFCIELEFGPQRKKESFASTNKSYDIEWWFDVLTSSKLALSEGRVPNPPLLVRAAPMGPASAPAVLPLVSGGKGREKHKVQRPLRRRQPKLPTHIARFERFTVYETQTHFHVVGSDRLYSQFRIFSLDRTQTNPPSLRSLFKEDVNVYDWEGMEGVLQTLDAEARMSATSPMGLIRAFAAVAIVGFVKFLQGYYLVLVTQRKKIGCIGGHFIYAIQGAQYLPIRQPVADGTPWTWVSRWLNPDAVEDAEDRYSVLFKLVDLTKDFYYSPTYDLTHTLQHNMTTNQTQPLNMFEWNYFLNEELNGCLTTTAARDDWVQPLIMGFYEQRKCSLFGRLISIIVLARRSRHFAGTRYLKRGIADTGKVANDVETEQILEDENTEGKFSSFVQYRGSIPIFWTQETSVTVPKPPIKLNRIDPSFSATQMHFADLFERYGSPVLVLNLVKQQEKTPREMILGKGFKDAVEYLNTFIPMEHRIRYVALDYSRLSKFKVDHSKVEAVRQALDKVGTWALGQTGFFCSAPKRQIGTGTNKRTARRTTPSSPVLKGRSSTAEGTNAAAATLQPPSPTIPRDSGDWLEQHGVLRTNCIDCLDRTNVAQFSVAMRALGQQLYAMGIRNTPYLESSSQILQELTLMFGHMGDVISMQYGGSEAHKNVVKSKENIKAWELLTSIRRYYSNAFTDNLKQDAINLFLGNYVPSPTSSPLWLLESDYYLHNFNVQKGLSLTEMGPFHRITNLKKESTRSAHDKHVYVAHRDALLPKWWKSSIEAFEAPKFVEKQSPVKPPVSGGSALGNDHRKASTASAASVDEASILQATDTEEFFSFDKALGHAFMLPVYIEAKDGAQDPRQLIPTPTLNHSHSVMAQKVRSMSAPEEILLSGLPSSIKRSVSNVRLSELQSELKAPDSSPMAVAGPTTTTASLDIEEYAAARGIRKEYIGSCVPGIPDAAYERYVESKDNLTFWEKENKSVRSDFLLYLRETSVDVDDIHGVYESAVRGGCTYKIQTGVYAGLDQNTRARALLTKKFFKTDKLNLIEDPFDEGNTVDPLSMELYSSYFDDAVIYPSVGGNDIGAATLESNAEPHMTAGVDFVSQSGTYDEYIVFNASAADQQFGDVMKTVNELSFVKKK